MSARNFTETFTAGERKRLPAGRFFYIRAAASSINIETAGNTGSPFTFVGIGAGSKFGPVAADQAWRYLDITSPLAQTVEIIISDDADFEVASAVTVAGNVNVSDASDTLTDTAGVACPTGATTLVAAANSLRRRVTVTCPATAGAPIYIRAGAGGANNLLEIQPGTFVELRTRAAVAVRNDTGGAVTVPILEET